MKEFRDKVAVVTGAASGIGKAIAERSVREGMKVVIADIEDEALRRATSELTALGGTVVAIKTDVSRRGDVEALAQKALDTFGAVHLLVNNAGVGAGISPWEATWNDWEWVIGVNLWGVINGIKVFTPLMLAQNTACHIVNTASVAGLVVGGSNAPYSVTKHGVVALSEGLYLTLEERKALVKVSVLCPGFVDTNIMNAERNRPVGLQNQRMEISPELQARIDFMRAVIKGGLSPLEVADQVFEAIREERFYIVTDQEWMQVVRQRVDNLVRLENPVSPADAVMKIIKPGA